MNALMIFAGLAIHYLLKYAGAMAKAKKMKAEFIPINWIKSEWIYIIVTLIFGGVVVLITSIPDQIKEYNGIIVNMAYVKYAVIGYAGASGIRNLGKLGFVEWIFKILGK